MRSALFFLSILVITSCSLLNEKEDKKTQQLIPLEVGNTWVFDINRPNNDVSTDTLSVVNDTLIGTKTWYKLESNEWLLDQQLQGYYLNHEDGLYKYSGSEEVSSNILMFKNTEEEGEGEGFLIETESAKWLTMYEGELQDDNFGVSSKKYTVEYVNITSSNRTFTLDQAYQFQRLISPEVGIIKWESAYLGLLNDSTLTLRKRYSFSLKEFNPAE